MRGGSLLRKSSRLASVWLVSGFGVVLGAPLAHAQDAPPAADAPAPVAAPSASRARGARYCLAAAVNQRSSGCGAAQRAAR